MKISRLGLNSVNAIVITFPIGTKVLVSYSTPVAAIINGKEYKTDTFWSVSTSRHINLFLDNTSTAERKPQAFFDNLLI